MSRKSGMMTSRGVGFPTLSFWRLVCLVLMATGTAATVLRFIWGLGATTNLSDEFPWGLWIGFDVLCGVGLAAGGFTVSAIVHLLNIEKYRPIARSAVLTAFIGYILVVGGLMFDLGHPWRIWHPIVMWNPHSVMFEVAWCVTLYTVVLAAEVSVWGSADQCAAGLREVVDAGARLVMLNPVFDELEQLETLVADVVPRL